MKIFKTVESAPSLLKRLHYWNILAVWIVPKCFHQQALKPFSRSLRRVLWILRVLHQLSIQKFILATRTDLISLKLTNMLPLSVFWSLCKQFLQLIAINNPKMTCQYVFMLSIFRTRICKMTWWIHVLIHTWNKLFKTKNLQFFEFLQYINNGQNLKIRKFLRNKSGDKCMIKSSRKIWWQKCD